MSPLLQTFANGSALGYRSRSAVAGSYESIATVTVGSGGAASAEFTSIPSTYTHLQIRAITNNPSTVTNYITFNNDNGSNYSWHYIYGDGSSVVAGGGATQTNMTSLIYSSTSSNIFFASVVDILDYANTNKYKTARSLTGWDTNGGGSIHLRSGLWQNTNAITSIKVAAGSGNFAQYSHFALYGIKSA